MEFIKEVSRDLEHWRASCANTREFDSATWRQLQNAAHNIGARAEGFKLGVMVACARELEQFALEVLTPTRSDKSESIKGAIIALEIMELELHSLRRTLQLL